MLPPVARQFIAGKTVESAVETARDLADDDITPILNQLGEHYDDEQPVEETVTEYEHLLDKLDAEDFDAAISLKPSQLGLDIDTALFEENAHHLVEYAVDSGVFVWFDMEASDTVDDTLSVYHDLVSEYPGHVGVCLQANLRRTPDDLANLTEYDGACVRLVKGAYKESESIAYTDKDAIDKQYSDLIAQAMQTMNGRVAVGTHHDEMINAALVKDQEYDTELEIQMLKGVRESRQHELATEHDMAQYIPYGDEWLSYTYRRIRENPQNLLFIGRAVLDSFT